MSLELVISGTVVKIEGGQRVEVQDRTQELTARIRQLEQELSEVQSLLKDAVAVISNWPVPKEPTQPAPTTTPRTSPTSTQKKKKFGERLRSIREAQGLSQGELRRRTGLPASMLSLYETGRRYPSHERLVALETALQLTPGTLG